MSLSFTKIPMVYIYTQNINKITLICCGYEFCKKFRTYLTLICFIRLAYGRFNLVCSLWWLAHRAETCSRGFKIKYLPDVLDSYYY